MVGWGEVTDGAWAWIEPLLPVQPARGGRWTDHRTTVNGILWKIRTGAPWRDLPARYGRWPTVYDRFRRWSRDGTWDRLLEEIVVNDDAVGRVGWTVSVDSTVVRAHQHAAGARHKPAKVKKGNSGSTTALRMIDRQRRKKGSAGPAAG